MGASNELAGRLSLGLRLVALGVWMLGCGCSEQRPCVDGEPGMHFIIHLPVDAGSPGELGVSYANGEVERFDEDLPDVPWPDPLEVRVAYGPDAVAGPASAIFGARPDPPRRAYAELVVEPDACVTVEMTLEVVSEL